MKLIFGAKIEKARKFIFFSEPVVEDLELPHRYRPENLDLLCEATGWVMKNQYNENVMHDTLETSRIHICIQSMCLTHPSIDFFSGHGQFCDVMPIVFYFIRFTVSEMKRIYRGFKTECPTGLITEEAFQGIYSRFFPHGGTVHFFRVLYNC